ncbi:T9SS type A sorting domain-containing protein [Psychroserpens burtonensis]|uniref:T9SS type A sorting domain-containing protein n=1 Tax=Psychroserpens burtonensis TaxID=49278 RepID=A0A5C7B878_9FLAO|nr:T9SS type A sorting domain-containing protein [Psychroserpens burtonensis]TXE16070.1 T9SS type A sorting domain-containing protein [Psychroserpens burtonensis]
MKALYYLCFAVLFLIPTKGICTSFDDVITTTGNQVQRVRIDVTTSLGYTRHLLLAFTPNNAATDAYDYGYDALNSDNYSNDSSWMVGEQRCVIQGVGAFLNTKAYPLGLFLSNAGNIVFSLTGLEHFDEIIEVFIYDAFTNTTTSISDSNFIETMPEGDSTNRFYVTFTNNISTMVFTDSTLSTSETQLATPQISYISSTKELQIISPNGLDIDDIHLYNILGQNLRQWSNLESNTFGNYTISMSNISKGTYLVSLKTKTGKFNKRLIISK